MAHASESQHWYDKDGNPVYEVPYADPSKGMRPATLADARKLGLVPGVSSIISQVNKPALNQWMQKQAILAALTLPRIDNEPEADYLERVLNDSREQARKAAERGTEIHAAIQSAYEGKSYSSDLAVFVDAARKEISTRFPDSGWIPERSFACPLGYGGKIDLLREEIVLDIKTKEFTEPKNLTWPEMAMQLIAYDLGCPSMLGIYRRCSNVFVSTKIPGLVHIHEWEKKDLQKAWAKFRALLAYWKSDKGI